MIQKERIQPLNDRDIIERPVVLYWMQHAQRTECNHALEYAISQANHQEKPLLVYFGVTESFPEANERHYRFMLEGLRETKAALEKRNIRMAVAHISPDEGAVALSQYAAMVVTDRAYLRTERAWRDRVAREASCAVIQVETDVIVPIETASSKEEYAARTIRPKITKLLSAFVSPLKEQEAQVSPVGIHLPIDEFNIEDVDVALKRLNLDRSVKPACFTGGTSRAKLLLQNFITSKLAFYLAQKNAPGLDCSSDLSPYLHFGQISPLYIYQRLEGAPPEPREAFLEELIIRRELSMNFVRYNDQYDAYASLPAWAKATLDQHRGDPRPYVYSLDQLERAETHDPYWNAAQTEMALTGKMNGYMRMYWGKKILEWGKTPEEAYKTALYLNNRYSLDGRDPNGFAGIAWCFGKHDRPWKERGVFGSVRYMNMKGLDRKFNMRKYVEKVSVLNPLLMKNLK